MRTGSKLWHAGTLGSFRLGLKTLFANNLAYRLTFMLITVVLVFLAVLQTFTRVYYSRVILDMAVSMQDQTMAYVYGGMSSRLGDAEKQMYELAIDSTFRRNIINIDKSSLSDSAFWYSQLRDHFRSVTERRKDLVAITLLTKGDHLVMYNRFSSYTSINIWQDPAIGNLSALRERSLQEPYLFYAVAPDKVHGLSCYHTGLNIWDFYSHETLATLIFTYDAQYVGRSLADPTEPESIIPGVPFDGIIQAHEQVTEHLAENVLNEPHEQAQAEIAHFQIPHSRTPYQFILMPEGTILASANLEDIGKRYEVPPDALIQSTVLNRQGLRLVSILDKNMLLQDMKVFQNTMMWFMLLVLSIWLLLLRMILGKVKRSLVSLRHSIEAVHHGSFETCAKVETQDELKEIAEAFNSMVSKIKRSDEEREKHMRDTIHAIDMQRIAEVSALENQINSHFLYNTLNAIHYTALSGDTGKVSIQIRQLADCLRYIFEKSSRVVKLSRELEWLEKYLFLQKQRYGDMFTYHIKAMPETMDWPIHKLVIQPFLENAIIHGFEGKRTGGFLSVRVRKFHDDRIWLTIEDNGNGMQPEKLKHLRQLFHSNDTPYSVSIGLENVRHRIRTWYGERARLYVSSTLGQGTRFTLLLPGLQDDKVSAIRKEGSQWLYSKKKETV